MAFLVVKKLATSDQLCIRVKETKRPLKLVRLLPKGRKKVELLIISTGFALQPCHRSCLASDCVDYRTSWLYSVSIKVSPACLYAF